MTHPCPSCGYCPTCGRRDFSPAPYHPWPWTPYQPWRPTTTGGGHYSTPITYGQNTSGGIYQ